MYAGDNDLIWNKQFDHTDRKMQEVWEQKITYNKIKSGGVNDGGIKRRRNLYN